MTKVLVNVKKVTVNGEIPTAYEARKILEEMKNGGTKTPFLIEGEFVDYYDLNEYFEGYEIKKETKFFNPRVPFKGFSNLEKYIYEEIIGIPYVLSDYYEELETEEEQNAFLNEALKYRYLIDLWYVDERSHRSSYQPNIPKIKKLIRLIGERNEETMQYVRSCFYTINDILDIPEALIELKDKDLIEYCSFISRYGVLFSVEEFMNKREFVEKLLDFVEKADNGRGSGSPYYVSPEQNAAIFRKYGKLATDVYGLVHWKAWADNIDFFLSADADYVAKLMDYEYDLQFIKFAVEKMNNHPNLDHVFRMWKRSRFAWATNHMEWEEVQVLDAEFGFNLVNKALGHSNWAVLELLFNFNIPTDLKEILEEIEIYNEEKNDLQRMKDVKKLYTSFKNKFNRLPKVFGTMIENIEGFNVDLVADSFNVKAMRYALTLEELQIDYQIDFAIALGDQIYAVVEKLRKNKRSLHDFIAGMSKVPFKSAELLKWVVSHAGTTPNRTIHQVVKFWDYPTFPREGTVKEMLAFIEKNQAIEEWQNCVEKYPYVFEKPFTCNIKDKKVVLNNESARILDANDKLQVMVGILTSCCQRLDSQGEAAMMEGLVNPDSGFLVFERGHKILAQAWVWLTEDRSVLVLDNIELADNRTPEDILDLLRLWVKNSPYKNIQMGTGYNEVSVGIPVHPQDLKWYKQHWKKKYTDAYNRVWLKKEGVMCI